MAKTQIHTTIQPDCDITAFVLSCNRLHLLERTMGSFLNTRDQPTKIVIIDDSGISDTFDTLVHKYGHIADVICFPENRGLWWAKDFMVSFCYTPYIFYIEEDWLFLGSGYLTRSKEILEQHRFIGSVDLSWRTFEDEGYDSYFPFLTNQGFYYKKPWRISHNHLHWFCWQGSPNLKRRQDLLLLGRVEGYYTEWNIDRKFYALGFRGVFLDQRYVMHLGDQESLMVNKRPNEGSTPESLYPTELLPYRTAPSLDYYGMDRLAIAARGDSSTHIENELCLATCILDISRDQYDNRDFVSHYLDGLHKIIEIDYPIVIFVDHRYYESVMAITGGKRIGVVPISSDIIKHRPYYDQLVQICESESFLQAEWMKNSIIKSPDYLGLTIHKMELLMHCARHQVFRSKKYFWIDAGICNSFGLANLKEYDFNKVSVESGKTFITRFPYQADKEIHGYSVSGYEKLCKKTPDQVCRATFFGGDKQALTQLETHYDQFIAESLEMGIAGTEESFLTGVALNNPELFHFFDMPNGDIKNYLNEIKTDARF